MNVIAGKSLFNTRPHPGPLPGGEGGRHIILAQGRKFETPYVVSYE
jgi:hypothetical protein